MKKLFLIVFFSVSFCMVGQAKEKISFEAKDAQTRAYLADFLQGKYSVEQFTLHLVDEPEDFDRNRSVIRKAISGEVQQKKITEIEKAKLLAFQENLRIAVRMHNNDVWQARKNLVLSGLIFGAIGSVVPGFAAGLREARQTIYPRLTVGYTMVIRASQGAAIGGVTGLFWDFSTKQSAFDDQELLDEKQKK